MITGATVQAATFAVMLLGLTYLYVDPTAADSHLRLFDTLVLVHAAVDDGERRFGGFAAYALARETSASGT